MKKSFITLLFVFSFFVNAVDNQFTVKSTITQGDKVIGQPVLTVLEGQPANISIGDTYNYEVTATELEDNQVLVTSELNIQGDSFTPKLTVELDSEASIQIGDTKLSIIVSRAKS